MAGNFYYRESKVRQEDIETSNRIRSNAFVTVTGKDFQLPYPTWTMDSTYNPLGTGRAAPVLKDVKISLEGEAASLRRVELSFTCFDEKSFSAAEKSLLIPGSEITVKYGYVGPSKPSEGGSYEFRVYDYSFKITKENYFECSLKGVTKGTGAEFDRLEINGIQSFPAGLTFVTDYEHTNETQDVQNLFDYIDYQVQSQLQRLDSKRFTPDDGECGKLTTNGHYAVLTAPNEYDPPTKLKTGWLSSDRIIYVTLQSIVDIVNEFILTNNENNYNIKFDDGYSAIDIMFPAGRIWSPSPFEMLFPYANGTPENAYPPSSDMKKRTETVNAIIDESPSISFKERQLMKRSMTVAKSTEQQTTGVINCDKFHANNSDVYNDFRIDRIASEGNMITGTPAGILLSRDMLRTIQTAFGDKPLAQDSTTEEAQKADSSINLIDFFGKIFAKIRDNSGGDWNLSLEINESDTDGTIWIVNKKSPVKDTVEPLVLSPARGVNGVRDLKLSAQVPKDIQAEAFGGAPNVTRTATNIIAENEAALNAAIDQYTKDLPRVRAASTDARSKINDTSFSADATTAAKGVIKQLVETLEPDGLAERNKFIEPVPYPLSVEIALDGIEGFHFGDTITSDYLPERYRLPRGARVVFTVTKYTHTIKENDWQTDLTAVSRIVKDD